MIPFLIVYVLLGLAVLLGNIRSRKVSWFLILYLGFLTANFGLALYSNMLAGGFYGENFLYKEAADFLSRTEYLLGLDLFDSYRIMNIGTILYATGTLYFPLTLGPARGMRFRLLLLPIGGLLFLFLFDPLLMKETLSIPDSPLTGQAVTPQISNILNLWNLTGNIILKGAVISGVLLMFKNYRKLLYVHKTRILLMIISLTPIHLLFLILFYWFPNHNVYYTRFAFLESVNMPFSRSLYLLITMVASLSLIILTYTIFRFGLLHLRSRRKKLAFSTRVNTAEQGMKIFSHAIKNQFIAARLLSEQIARESGQINGTSPVKIRELTDTLEGICSASIEQLGSLTRKTGTLSLHYKREDIWELIDQVVREFSFKYKNWAFSFKGERGSLIIDRGHFLEVMRNFLSNAVEAQVDDSPRRIHITQHFAQDYCIISVRDWGMGIPPRKIKQIFNPFYTTKPSITNWGLGLSYCMNVIEAFGGTIEAECLSGEGCKMNIYLPKMEKE